MPEILSKWRRKDAIDPGFIYIVTGITNTAFSNPKYPPQVVYQGSNGSLWSKALSEWPGNLEIINEEDH